LNEIEQMKTETRLNCPSLLLKMTSGGVVAKATERLAARAVMAGA